MTVSFCIPIRIKWEFQLLASLSVFGIAGDLDFSYCNRCIVASHCSVNLHFRNNRWYWAFFYVLLAIHTFFFFWWSVWFKWVMRVLSRFWMYILYNICDLQIFSPKLWLVFLFSWQCLLKGRFLILVKSNLSIFFFYGVCFFVSSLRNLCLPQTLATILGSL